MAFLRIMKQEHPEMQFRLTAASNGWLLRSEEDIERFGWELPAVFFQRDTGSIVQSPPEEEVFVFSTVYDRGLPSFLSSQTGARQYVFRTGAAEGGDGNEGTTVIVFQGGCACVPGSWILRREPRLREPRISSPAFGKLEEERLSVRVL
jgi:hypothetical protein